MIARRMKMVSLLLAMAVGTGGVLGDDAGTASAPVAKVGAVVPGSRVLKMFDFEETALGNHEDTPMFWQKVAGRGYPIYSMGKFDRAVSRSAGTSFRVDLDGGSVAYRYAPGKIPINPAADYFVVGWVKTTALRHARAEVTAWLADEKGNLIPSTEGHSNTVGGAAAKGAADPEWRAMQLYIPGSDNAAAKSLVLQLGLLQPQQLTPGVLGKFELYQQDLKGSAWFDDVVVFQLPRVSIGTRAVANVFSPGQKIDLDLTVSDLGHDGLQAGIYIQDAENKVVFQDSWHVTAESVAGGKPWIRHVQRPPLPPGLYTATLDVTDAARKAPITRRQVQFVMLATDPGANYRASAQEFGLDAASWPVDAWDQLPHLLKSTNAGLVALPAWRRDMTEDDLLRRDQPFDTLIASLLKTDTRTIASFSEVPSVLTSKLSEKTTKSQTADDSILALLEADPAVWRPYTSFILARYANRVDYWQLGRSSDAFYSNDPRYPRVYSRARTELVGLLNSPKLMIPWNAFYEFDPKIYPSAMLDLHVPAAIKPAQIPAYMNTFSAAGAEMIVHLSPLDRGPYTRMDRLADFARRVVYTRSANPKATLVDIPMVRRSELFTQSSQPTELLIVYRTLIAQLGGAKFVRAFDPAPGIHAFLFDRDGAGTLAMWADAADKSPTKVALPLGNTPALVDLWGNTSTLLVVKGVTTVEVTTTPVFVTGVDSRLVELRASFSLEMAKFPAGAGSIRTSAKLHNPYGTPLAGMLQFLPPKGWSFDPPSVQVALAANGELSAPVTISYPYSDPVGPKTINARLTTEVGTVDMTFHAALTSDVVDVECYALLQPDGQLVLQQMITNISPSPINAQAYALVPGLARQQRYILDLKPSQTTIKRFTFKLEGDAAAYVGKTASIGVRQTDGKTLVTKSVPLE